MQVINAAWPTIGPFVTVQNGRLGRVASRGPAVICSKTGGDRPRLIDATAPRWSCQPGWAQLRPPGHRRPKRPGYGHPGAIPPVIQRCQGREMESAAGSPSPRRRPRAGPARLSSRTRAASEWSFRNRRCASTERFHGTLPRGDCAGGTLPRGVLNSNIGVRGNYKNKNVRKSDYSVTHYSIPGFRAQKGPKTE